MTGRMREQRTELSLQPKIFGTRSPIYNDNRAAFDICSRYNGDEAHHAHTIRNGNSTEPSNTRVPIRRIPGAEIATGYNQGNVTRRAGSFKNRTTSCAWNSKKLFDIVLTKSGQYVAFNGGHRRRSLSSATKCQLNRTACRGSEGCCGGLNQQAPRNNARTIVSHCASPSV